MRVNLTDRFVAGAKAGEAAQVDYFDAGTPGLSLRVSRTGRKAWCFVYKAPTGRLRRLTIGSYPATSLAAARRKAIEARGHLDEDRDPRAVMEDRAAGAMTVAGLVDSYLEKYARPNLRSAAAIERRLRKNVVPMIGDVKLSELHRRDINRVVDPVLKRGRRVEAARVFEDSRAMLRWATGRGDIDVNPIAGMQKPGTSSPRERVLSDEEIRTLWKALPKALSRSKTCQRIIRLCLATGQRVGEIAGMRVAELDLRQRVWRLPGARVKNKHAHVVPLSDLALAIIKEAVATAGEGTEWVFPNPDGDGPLPPHAVARTITRAQERIGVDHWTAHDLRRTAITGMARLGVAPIVLGHVINHRSVTKAGVTLSVYSHYDYAAETRAALDLWADRLAGIVSDGAKVLPMPRPAKR